MNMNHCDHGDDKKCTFLEFSRCTELEVYLCECGALIDISNEKNFTGPFQPMNADEIEAMIKVLMEPYKEAFVDIENIIHKIGGDA